MDKKVIYLAGPMENLSTEDMCDWRIEANNRLSPHMRCLDPTRRTPLHEREDNLENYAKMLFHADLADIDRSDLILVNARRDAGRAWGTCMETMYAWKQGKPIILWIGEQDVVHPFHVAMGCIVTRSLDSAINHVIEMMVE